MSACGMMIGSQVRVGVWRMIAGRDNIDVEEVVVVEAARIGMPDFRLDPPPILLLPPARAPLASHLAATPLGGVWRPRISWLPGRSSIPLGCTCAVCDSELLVRVAVFDGRVDVRWVRASSTVCPECLAST